MKKFIKGCLCVALFFLGAGLALAIAGCALGGADQVSSVVQSVTGGKVNVNLDPSSESFGINVGGFSTDDVKNAFVGILDNKIYNIEDYGTIYDDGEEILTGNVEKHLLSTGDVDKLRIDVAGCELKLVRSEDEGFWIEAKEVSQLQAYVKEDVLRIISTLKNKTISGADIKKSVITLYIPEEYCFEEAEVELGAGIFRTEELYAKQLKLEVGAGQAITEKVICDECKVEIGAGDGTFTDAELGKLDCEVGAGNLSLKGVLNEDVKVSCAMGNIDLKLSNKVTDFDYKIECAAGNVDLDGRKYSGLANSQKIDNDAGREMKLECSVGNVTVRFE